MSTTINALRDARSGVLNENLQEILDASSNKFTALDNGQQQYQTPAWLATACARLLPFNYHNNVIDLQCAAGNLLAAVDAGYKFGVEIDNRLKGSAAIAGGGHVARITGNCVSVMETMDELYPSTRFDCMVVNPPFGLRFKTKTGPIDSTEWTWRTILHRLNDRGCGFFIASAKTIEALKIPDHPWVYLYQRFPGGGVWDNVGVELGIVHFHNCQRLKPRVDRVWDHVPSPAEIAKLFPDFDLGYRPYFSPLIYDWEQLGKIMDDERLDRPKFNIYLNKDGMLKTYLSTRASIKFKRDDILRLARINDCHPLTLTTERETRKLLHEFLSAGVYTIHPEAVSAISSALLEVASMACPISPVTNFELVAYAEEEDSLKCKAADPTGAISLSVGKRYEILTGTYGFVEKFNRSKPHFDAEEEEMTIEVHECQLHGEDRYAQVTDDKGRIHRFMDRPQDPRCHHPEELLWQLFSEPYVASVAEVHADRYERNIGIMKVNEQVAGFTYFDGQLDYYARMGCKDYGLIAADVGTGKTLGALTIVAIKAPARTLIIAPQGTMRSVGEEDEIDYEASQWVKEIHRFAPTEPVFQLFSREDWLAILHANGGELPPGIYITYPQAYFSNGSFESLPPGWSKHNQEEEKFCERFGLPYDAERPIDGCYHRNVGATNAKGIRCIAVASLSTLVYAQHTAACWDMVILDEAHLCCNVESQVARNLLRMQPKYRFAMTATPIPNIVSNLFSLMGWLCVPDWYRGDRRSAAWPYAVNEIGRFNATFLCTEVDMTEQQKAKAAGKRGWRSAGTRSSPVISSPARLLKLIKPTVAYISKEDCNSNLHGCEVMDVRVAMGKEQAVLYQYWLDRANYMLEFKGNALNIARAQSGRLRGVCASPASLDYTRGMCKSSFNPKIVAILQLIRDCLRRGEQVVCVAARVGQTSSIATRLSEAGIPLARIDSTVKADLHTAEANRFKRGDARVMLMGIKCAQGHSFDQCPNLIVGSLEWSYGTLHQAKGRVWRLNSPKPVKVWCVLHENTIEELLFDRVAVKQDSATLCLHGKRVPRDFRAQDADEVIAEHIVNFNLKDGGVLSETECESQWPELRAQLVIANKPVASDKAA